MGDRRIPDSRCGIFDQAISRSTSGIDIDDLDWSAGDTVEVRLDDELQTARGERINYRLEADGEWHDYELEPDLYYCKVQCYWEGHRFVVNLQV